MKAMTVAEKLRSTPLLAAILVALGPMAAWADDDCAQGEDDDGALAAGSDEGLACGTGADARGWRSGNTAIGTGALASGPRSFRQQINYGSYFVEARETIIDEDGNERGTTLVYRWAANAADQCFRAARRAGVDTSHCDRIRPHAAIPALNRAAALRFVQRRLAPLEVVDVSYYDDADRPISSPSHDSNNTAIGHSADARGNNSRNVALGARATAFGHGRDVDGDGRIDPAANVAIGWRADASGNGESNVAIGANASASGNSIAIGAGAQASNGQIVIGQRNMTDVQVGAYDLRDIRSNTSRIEANEASIVANTADIQENDAWIQKLHGAVLEVDEHVGQVAAMAAALSAVPNAVPGERLFVGVGVGGHGGEEGVAVGVAGRLGREKNIHLNVGAATSDGETTVRAGVGWAF